MRQATIGKTTLRLVEGDITRQPADAIVNAANEALSGGGGVDGAIHRVGGPTIMEECRKLGHCPTGQAVVTAAGRLPARYVMHTVGPVWRGGRQGEENLLASAYASCLVKAAELGLKSIVFPSLSTGAYGYPLRDAARVAMLRRSISLEINAWGKGLARNQGTRSAMVSGRGAPVGLTRCVGVVRPAHARHAFHLAWRSGEHGPSPRRPAAGDRLRAGTGRAGHRRQRRARAGQAGGESAA